MAAPEEQQVITLHFHGEMNWPFWNRNTTSYRKAQAAVWKIARARQDCNNTSHFFMQCHGQRMELVAIIIMGQASDLLIGIW
ncbi:hypothetical protein D3C80_1618760 [compost metagenome]